MYKKHYQNLMRKQMQRSQRDYQICLEVILFPIKNLNLIIAKTIKIPLNPKLMNQITKYAFFEFSLLKFCIYWFTKDFLINKYGDQIWGLENETIKTDSNVLRVFTEGNNGVKFLINVFIKKIFILNLNSRIRYIILGQIIATV